MTSEEKELAFVIDALQKMRGCIVMRKRNDECDKKCMNYIADAEAIFALDTAISIIYRKKFCMGSVQDPY